MKIGKVKKNKRSISFISKILTLSGFSLIELVVAIAIVSALIAGSMLAINPAGQANKGKDAARLSDINAIREALEVYYEDTRCFPQASGSPFATALANGTSWNGTGSTVYMVKVPKDPLGVSYTYITDPIACPQWNIVYAQLSKDQIVNTTTNTTPLCPVPLSAGPLCAPGTFSNKRWACAPSGYTGCTP